MPSILLAGSVASRVKSCRDPKPHSWFYVRCEDDARTWRVVIYDEDEVPGLDRLAVGDVLSVAGALHIRAATDSQGRRRLALQIIGRQMLLLRRRSRERAAGLHEQPAQLNGFRVG
jgi:single-stranded DNA-binding protein